jgi:glucose/mannose transport system substrate-binding protein
MKAKKLIQAGSAIAVAVAMTTGSMAYAGTTSKVDIFSWWTAGGEADGLKGLLQVFHQEYPQFQVINDAVAGGAGSNAKAVLASRMTAHQPPDSFQGHADAELNAYVNAGEMEPLDSLYKSQGWSKVFPATLINDLKVKGHIYAIPVDVHRGNVMWYNPTIFKKYKLTPPSTFAQFFADAKVLKSHGITPLALGDTDQWESVMLWENVLLGSVGPTVYQEVFKGQVKFTDPRVKAATQTFVQMLQYTNSNHAALQWQDASGLVSKGQAAMNLMGDWAKGYYTSLNLKPMTGFGWSAFPGTQGDFEFITDAFGLPKGAPNPTGATDFLKVLGSEKGQAAFNPKKGSIAARTDVPAKIFDVYSQAAMKDFKVKTLVPSLAHGEVANPGFTSAANQAIEVLVSTKNVNQFLSALESAKMENPLK